MKKIQAYEANDGKLFASETQCKNYEIIAQAKSQLTNLIEKECYNGMNKEAVKDFLVQNVKELTKILLGVQET